MSLAELDPASLGEVSQGAYVRRHHVGVDAQTTSGAFVFRQDVALDSKMVFLRADLDGVALPAVQAVAGVEYQTGVLGQAVLLELHHLQILGVVPEDALMLQRAANTTAVATVRWKAGDLVLDGQLAQGLHPRSTVFRPEVGWQREHLDVRLGALLLGGEPRSFGRHFTESSCAYATVKYLY
jgi:hypothetical protein